MRNSLPNHQIKFPQSVSYHLPFRLTLHYNRDMRLLTSVQFSRAESPSKAKTLPNRNPPNYATLQNRCQFQRMRDPFSTVVTRLYHDPTYVIYPHASFILNRHYVASSQTDPVFLPTVHFTVMTSFCYIVTKTSDHWHLSNFDALNHRQRPKSLPNHSLANYAAQWNLYRSGRMRMIHFPMTIHASLRLFSGLCMGHRGLCADYGGVVHAGK